MPCSCDWSRSGAAGSRCPIRRTSPGLRVLAAPVLDADGVPLAALSVAAPAFAMPLKAFDAASRKPVMAAAAKLSRAVQAAGAGVSPVSQRTISK